MTDNLRALAWRADDNSKAAVIHFQARAVEEAVSFKITTSAPIISTIWRMPGLRGGQWLSLAESKGTNHYAISLDRRFLNEPFVVGLEIESQGDPSRYIVGVEIWDRRDAEPQIVYIDFDSAPN